MKQLLDAILPPACAGCGREGHALCPACGRQLERRAQEPAGWPLGLSGHLPWGIVQLEWCASFNGPARAAVHCLKYEGELRLVGPLSDAMAERWRHAAIGGDALVPVPVHVQRRRERGFDQAELLARGVAQRLGLPVWRALERGARTRAQHQLGRRARERNVTKAFAVRPQHAHAVKGRWIVIVDDVTTTGATLAACASALYEAGACAVSALTLGRER